MGHDRLYGLKVKKQLARYNTPVEGRKKWIFIDIAVPADQNIIKTKSEKIERYQEVAYPTRNAEENDIKILSDIKIQCQNIKIITINKMYYHQSDLDQTINSQEREES